MDQVPPVGPSRIALRTPKQPVRVTFEPEGRPIEVGPKKRAAPLRGYMQEVEIYQEGAGSDLRVSGSELPGTAYRSTHLYAAVAFFQKYLSIVAGSLSAR